MGFTRQRQAVLKILSDSNEHLTVDEIFEKARQVFPNMAQGTVYRNLNILADEGIIRRLQIPGQPVRFDRNTIPHQHMLCVRCGNIADIGVLEHTDIQKLTGSQIEIADHALVIYVMCNRCSGNVEKNRDC